MCGQSSLGQHTRTQPVTSFLLLLRALKDFLEAEAWTESE